MSTTITYIKEGWIFQEFLSLLGHMVQSNLIQHVEYLRVENRILRRRLGKRIVPSPRERRQLIKYGIPLGDSIRHFISIVHYTTFRRWVRNEKMAQISPAKKRGRRRTSEEIRGLVVRLAQENSWGYTRILGELRKLGIKSISRTTVKNILREYAIDPVPVRSTDTWNDFLARHVATLWACDFFTKTAWTLLGPKTYYVLFFINVHTRKVHITGITRNPTQQWVEGQMQDVSFLPQCSKKARPVLIRDRDTKFSKTFDTMMEEVGIRVKPIPYQSPNLNPYAESWIGIIKRECLDYFFVFGKHHLQYLIAEYVTFYNTVRPHSSKGNMPLQNILSPRTGTIQCDSRLGGVIRHYFKK